MPRFVFSDFPLGNSAGKPNDPASQRATLQLALDLLNGATGPRATLASPQVWHDDDSWQFDFMNINALPADGMAGLKLGDLYPLDEEAGRASIARAVALCDRWHGAEDGRITTMLGPQGTDMIGKSQLLEVARIAEERGLMLHIHVAQGDREIEQMVKRYGQRTPEFLADNGLLNERLLAVHLTEASDEETDRIAESGARMALCSGSIGIIDGIVPPAHRFRQKGGIVGLGSDQASGNNCNNIFNEMKLTALFNKIRYRDPEIMPAWEVLRMGTIEGAQAMGLGHRIGSLETGKQADLIVVDVSVANMLPIIDEPIRTLVPNLIYAGTGKEVRTMGVLTATFKSNASGREMAAVYVPTAPQTKQTQVNRLGLIPSASFMPWPRQRAPR